MKTAYIIFEFNGQRYEYDGGLPTEVANASAHLYDSEGFWIGGYPANLPAGADEDDELPTARWEIEHVGGKVIEVIGARENGAVHYMDWKHPRIY
jgi:hypothetical protein